MEYMLLGIVLGLCFFITTIKAYTLGLSHGKQLANGNMPRVDVNPVKSVIKAVENRAEKKEAEKIGDEIEEILGYDYGAALNAVKKEM